MPLCQTSAPQATLARAALAGFRPQTRPLFLLIAFLLMPPSSAEAVILRLDHVQFPDTMAVHLDPHHFAPAPTPWLMAIDPPDAKSDPVPPLDAYHLARRFDRIAAVPLLDSADAALLQTLDLLGQPRPIPVISGAGTPIDEGSTTYLIISSLTLFIMSSLIGYVTRERLPYSVGAEWHTEGGRRTVPPLLLPPAAPSRY